MIRNMPLAFVALALAACAGGTDTTSPTSRLAPHASAALGLTSVPSAGAVFTSSNSTSGNAVLAFARASDGSLTAAGSFVTGGTGTGGGLGSQGAVTLSNDGSWLFAVNAASNSISSFAVNGTSLSLIGTVPSGGTTPISIAVKGNLLYVLNAGVGGNVVGFTISGSGALAMLPGSSRPLSASGVGPAQVGFDPTQSWLVVPEKGTNLIDVYYVRPTGYVSEQPITNVSAGRTPFGFAFSKQGLLVVSEAFGGAPNASAGSSYVIGTNGRLRTITASAPTLQTAACWVVVTDNGKFAYMTNTGSASVTGYSILQGGLTNLNVDGLTGVTAAGPIDAASTKKYLYTLDGNAHEISAFATAESNGSLSKLSSTGGLPAGAIGLAAK